MIKNQKQYRIANAQVRRFEDALAGLARQKRPPNVTPRLWQAQRNAAESQLEDLREAVERYRKLHDGKETRLLLTAVEELPQTLIRARIAAGITQEGLAQRLGVKAQQVQRYEATEYESASFARIRKVVQVLGLKMPKPVVLVRDSG